MRKILSAGLAIVILISMLWFSTAGASAKGLIFYSDGRFIWGKGVVFVFDASGYRNRDVRGSSIFVSSDFYDLYCSVDRDAGKIVCVGSGGLTRYAGQTGIIYLAGQVFYVTIPDKPALFYGNGSLSCPGGTASGADVTFFTSDESTFTLFISGSTPAEVHKSAQSYLGGFILSIEDIGNLYCGEESLG